MSTTPTATPSLLTNQHGFAPTLEEWQHTLGPILLKAMMPRPVQHTATPKLFLDAPFSIGEGLLTLRYFADEYGRKDYGNGSHTLVFTSDPAVPVADNIARWVFSNFVQAIVHALLPLEAVSSINFTFACTRKKECFEYDEEATDEDKLREKLTTRLSNLMINLRSPKGSALRRRADSEDWCMTVDTLDGVEMRLFYGDPNFTRVQDRVRSQPSGHRRHLSLKVAFTSDFHPGMAMSGGKTFLPIKNDPNDLDLPAIIASIYKMTRFGASPPFAAGACQTLKNIAKSLHDLQESLSIHSAECARLDAETHPTGDWEKTDAVQRLLTMLGIFSWLMETRNVEEATNPEDPKEAVCD